MHPFAHRVSMLGCHFAALAMALACAAPESDRAPDSAAPVPPAAGQAPVVHQAAPWRTVPWYPYQAPVTDYGRGVITLSGAGEGSAPGGVSGPLPRRDSLIFRSQPDSGAAVAGLFVILTDTVSSDSAWHYAVAAPGLRTPNLVEFGYEESGVPIDSTSPDGHWVRGRLGTDDAGAALIGWADARDPRIEQRWWADHLPQQTLFAIERDSLRVASEPEGVPVPLPDGEFVLHPTDTVRGRWLLVQLVAPSDYCASDDSVAYRTQRVWVEYLDSRGRPRVWYASRGC